MPSSLQASEIVQWALRTERLKAQVAAENIANATTPNAKTQHVDFSQSLAQVKLMSAIQHSTLSDVVAPTVITSNQPIALDQEVVNLSEAELKFRVLSDGVSRQLSLLSLAINGNR